MAGDRQGWVCRDTSGTGGTERCQPVGCPGILAWSQWSGAGNFLMKRSVVGVFCLPWILFNGERKAPYCGGDPWRWGMGVALAPLCHGQGLYWGGHSLLHAGSPSTQE